jgi:hypothetical protein
MKVKAQPTRTYGTHQRHKKLLDMTNIFIKSSRTQNQFTKIRSLCAYQQWIVWKRIQVKDSLSNSLKRLLNLMKEVKDLYNENYNHWRKK